MGRDWKVRGAGILRPQQFVARRWQCEHPSPLYRECNMSPTVSVRRLSRPHLCALTLSQSARVRSSVRASATLRTSRPRLQGREEKEGHNAEVEAAGGGRGDEAAADSARCAVQGACIHGGPPPCMHAPMHEPPPCMHESPYASVPPIPMHACPHHLTASPLISPLASSS